MSTSPVSRLFASALVVSAVLPLGAVVSSCADVIGLDNVDRVPCAADCGAGDDVGVGTVDGGRMDAGGVVTGHHHDASSSGHNEASTGDDSSPDDMDGEVTPETGSGNETGVPPTDSGGKSCLIDGGSFSPGTVNPANSCQECKSGRATWANVPDGTGCGTGSFCESGACTPGCEIGGVFLAASAVNSANGCQLCEPSTPSAWSNQPNGTSCGTDKFCVGGACSAAGCFVSGAFTASGAADPANGCQSCQPGVTSTAFSNIPDGTVCGAGVICHSGGCVSGCDIGGTFFAAGAADPSNICMTCQPATSATMFTAGNAGTACGGSCGTCSGGACANSTLLATGAACTTSAECCDDSCACTMTCGKSGCSCATATTCGGG